MTVKNYALEWYEYGLKNDDPIIRFMMFWVAFNWLYKECREERDDTNIKSFCHRKYEKLIQFDAFSSDAFQVFLEKPVRDETNGYERRSRFDSIKNDRGPKRVENLLLTIYQVRCNLFHGSKKLQDPRDMDLVCASADILKGYLEVLL